MATATSPAPLVRTPETIDQILKLTKFQFLDYLRSRRFLLLIGLVSAIGAILTAVLGYFRPVNSSTDPLSFYSTLWGNGFDVVVILAVVIMGGDAIAGEFQNKTGYFLMGLPIRRATVYVGKYIAVTLASLAAMFLFLAIVVGNGFFYLGTNALPGQLGVSVALAIVYMLAVLGATFLFSSMFKTSTYATLIVAILFLFGFSILQDVIVALWKIEPYFVISYAQSVVLNALVNPYPPHVQVQYPFGPGGPSMTVYTPTIVEGVIIMLVYFVVTSVLGLFLFSKEEFS